MTELIDKLRAALAAAYDSEWPHRPACQMLKPVPEGFPFGGFSCNCNAATIWMNTIEAHRKIVDSYDKLLAQQRALRQAGRKDMATVGGMLALLGVVKSLAKVYEIEVDK